MADLSGLSNDELASGLRDHLVEAETRLQDAGMQRELLRVKRHHLGLWSVGVDLVTGGQVSTDSVGGDK